MDDELGRAFQKLRADGAVAAVGTYLAWPIRTAGGHLAALTSANLPCILLRAVDVRDGPVPPLRLQGLEIQYDINCLVAVSGSPARDEVFTTVVCTSHSPLEQEYFVHAAEMVLRTVGTSPTVEEIAVGTRHLASIFQKLARPARQSITGLIGELMLIRLAVSPATAVMAWHLAETERFDFVIGQLRVDAKATERRERSHYLSYEQCHPPEGTTGILFSLFVESIGGGLSVRELVAELESLLIRRPDAILRLHEVIADSLGQSLPHALGERFDYALAESSVRLFDLRKIPAIRGLLPPLVSELRFKSQLIDARPLSLTTISLSEVERELFPVGLLQPTTKGT